MEMIRCDPELLYTNRPSLEAKVSHRHTLSRCCSRCPVPSKIFDLPPLVASMNDDEENRSLRFLSPTIAHINKG